jgi:hypothetical protein
MVGSTKPTTTYLIKRLTVMCRGAAATFQIKYLKRIRVLKRRFKRLQTKI